MSGSPANAENDAGAVRPDSPDRVVGLRVLRVQAGSAPAVRDLGNLST